jgi:hypothetical protein
MGIVPSLRLSLALLACAATFATTISAQAASNIVILYADDMGYGDLGANNPASKIPTPHLDRLAAQGVRFTDGHSSSGICTPSRYALLTGRHHWRDFHTIVGPFGGPAFKPGQLTMPQMLRQKGYATAAFGKWHLGWDWNAIRRPGTPKDSLNVEDFDWSLPVPGGPLDHGFDTYFGDDVINFPPYAWIDGNRLPRAPNITIASPKGKNQIAGFPSRAAAPKEGTWGSRPGPALSDWNPYTVNPTLTQRTVDYILARRGQTKPFFLYVPFPSPHEPIIPQTEFRGRSQAGPYGDYVVETDAACGRILAAIEQAGFADNTLVIFTADNGAETECRRDKGGKQSCPHGLVFPSAFASSSVTKPSLFVSSRSKSAPGIRRGSCRDRDTAHLKSGDSAFPCSRNRRSREPMLVVLPIFNRSASHRFDTEVVAFIALARRTSLPSDFGDGSFVRSKPSSWASAASLSSHSARDFAPWTTLGYTQIMVYRVTTGCRAD